MINVTIPSNNIRERDYIIAELLYNFLGIDYKIKIGNQKFNVYEIEVDNGNRLIIEDHFFCNHLNDLEYLKETNIPEKIEFGSNDFMIEDNIPIIYGTDTLEIKNQKPKTITCGIDIFASSFFMLARWEEYVNKTRDAHDRFPATASLAYKENFLNRPVVNEYVEMLWNMISFLGYKGEKQEREFREFVSCDVDEPFDCTVENATTLVRVCAGDIIKRKNFLLALKRVQKFVCNKLGIFKYDENYTFDWYLDVCEKAGLKASFYFIPDNTEKGNGCYNLQDKKIRNLLKYIDKRGHEIGVHGSYQTYKDTKKAYLQKKRLEKVLHSLDIDQKVKGNRQHYLRWDSSVTPSVLDEVGFEYDTSGGYADQVGFRYGVCYEFNMFDFLRRKRLGIKQRPLIVMECTVIDDTYMGLGYGLNSINLILSLKECCRRFHGDFSLLWHNNHLKSFNDRKLFEKILYA